MDRAVKIVILQRVSTCYRTPLFRELTKKLSDNFCLFVGESFADEKAKNCKDLSGINLELHKTKRIRIGTHNFYIHKKLIRNLYKNKPDVIICEGESSFLSYLKAILYRLLNPNTKLIHWSLGALPGVKDNNSLPRLLILMLKKSFDGYLVYSSYGKKRLIKQGIAENKIFISVNVSDTAYHLNSYKNSQQKAININYKFNPNKKYVLFVGAIVKAKNLEFLLDVAETLKDNTDIIFIIVGDGDQKSHLEEIALEKNLRNCHFVGKVTKGLPEYYIKSDLFFLPGRGGMVISEAMCYRLPVIAYQADGVEHDLLQHGHTGFLLKNNKADEAAATIKECLKKDLKEVGISAQELIIKKYSTHHMAESILESINYVTSTR